MPAGKRVILSYSKRLWEDRDLNVIEELMHPDVILRSLLGNFHGHQAMKDVVKTWFLAFPDLRVDFTSIINEKDLVMTQWNASGTHLGEFKGYKATGRLVKYSGVTIYKVQRNLITEYWAYLDMQNILNQIK